MWTSQSGSIDRYYNTAASRPTYLDHAPPHGEALVRRREPLGRVGQYLVDGRDCAVGQVLYVGGRRLWFEYKSKPRTYITNMAGNTHTHLGDVLRVAEPVLRLLDRHVGLLGALGRGREARADGARGMLDGALSHSIEWAE